MCAVQIVTQTGDDGDDGDAVIDDNDNDEAGDDNGVTYFSK